MPTSKELIEEYVNYLNYHTELYNGGVPEISDEEWDNKYFTLLEMEKKTGIVLEDSPTRKIIYKNIKGKLNKVEHNHLMLSLEKTKDIKDLLVFGKKADVSVTPKLDGLTCSLRYMDGKLVSAETRGNGRIGEDVTHNAFVIKNIPKTIKYDRELVVDGEVICKLNVFEEEFQEHYKNPRNFVSGSIRLLDSKECETRRLSFVAWDCIKGFDEIDSYSQKLEQLSLLGFEVVPWYKKFFDNNKNEQEVDEAIKEIKSISQETHHYPIDGLVFRYDYIPFYEAEGRTEHHFSGALAFKFYDEGEWTVLEAITYQPSRTGVLTPVAIFKPVELEGTTVGRASLHNLTIMSKVLKQPFFHQQIKVVKSNMIIPQIVDCSQEKPPRTAKKRYFEIPNKCPACGGELKIKKDFNSEILVCENPNCRSRLVDTVNHFCSKKGMDIKGFSKKTIEDLVEFGWISQIKDIYSLKDYENEWVKKSGYGKKKVNNILNEIEKSKKEVPLENFVSAIGIPGFAKAYVVKLTSKMHSYQDLRDKIEEGFDFTTLDGIGENKDIALKTFDFSEFDEIAKEYLNFKDNECYYESGLPQHLNGVTVVITGKLKKYKNRRELAEKIESYGGRVVDSVSGKTTLLICNDKNSTSSKAKKARDLGIEILTEEEFEMKML